MARRLAYIFAESVGRRLWVLLLVLPALGQNGPLEGFDRFVDGLLKSEGVPGASVVVVSRNGGVLASKGYGLRDVASGKPVTSKTIFPLASATKTLTALSLAALVDSGKLSWDSPIRNYLPDFRLFDAYASEQLTLRDLLSHRSGLPRYDGVWYGNTFGQAVTVNRLRYLEPSASFRSEWQYSNMNFTIAAYLQGQVDGGREWEESVRIRVLEPLAMAATSCSLADLEKQPDHSSPYVDLGSGLEPAPFMKLTAVAGAGALNSNADDLAHYLLMLVNKGNYNGKKIVSEQRLAELLTPVMVVPWGVDNQIVGQTTYGLGWFLSTYRGHRMAWHWGSAPGFSTIVALLPDDGVAVAILANRGQSKIPDIIAYNVWDRMLGVTPPEDWAARFKPKTALPGKPAEMVAVASQEPRKASAPSHPPGDYAGTYDHPGYGRIVIAKLGDGLTATFNGFTSRLEHLDFDVFQTSHANFSAIADQKLQFRLDVDGQIESLLWDVEAGVPRGVFVRSH